MAKKDVSKDIVKTTGLPNLPKFMQDDGSAGTEALQEFVIPPRIKIVQKQARSELLELFTPGDVILSPVNAVIVEQERDNKGRIIEDTAAQFNIVPLFFYPEWGTINPIELRASEPMLRYRTTDPTDPIVQKARNKHLREEVHPEREDLRIRHVEFLNYIVMLVNHELTGTPALLSFSKGEWMAGSNFASLIKMRKAPLFGCVFTCTVVLRPGTKGEWYGINVTNPSDRMPFVEDADTYEVFKKLNAEFSEFHKHSKLKADLDDSDETVDVSDNTEF